MTFGQSALLMPRTRSQMAPARGSAQRFQSFRVKEGSTMTLNQLKYFCAASRYHSIARAAQELYVTPPTISIAIRELEQEFHLTLFSRVGNKLTLTSEGEAFYQRAQALLTQSQEIYAQFSDIGKHLSPVRVGIPPMLSIAFFPELLLAFRKEHPDIVVELLEYGSVRACELVQDELLDLSLVNMEHYNMDKLNSHLIGEDQFVFCVSPRHPLAGASQITLDMLKEEPLALFNTDSVQNQMLKLRFEALNIQPRVCLNSSQLFTVCKFLKTFRCGAFFYASLLPYLDDVVGIPLDPPLKSDIGLVWKKGKYLNSHIKAFLDFTQAYYKRHPLQ